MYYLKRMEETASATLGLPGENAQSIHSGGVKTVEVLSVELKL